MGVFCVSSFFFKGGGGGGGTGGGGGVWSSLSSSTPFLLFVFSYPLFLDDGLILD